MRSAEDSQYYAIPACHHLCDYKTPTVVDAGRFWRLYRSSSSITIKTEAHPDTCSLTPFIHITCTKEYKHIISYVHVLSNNNDIGLYIY